MNFPVRSPLAVADVINSFVVGKRYCEIGCNEGDLLALIRGAKSVIGIEKEDYRDKWQNEGLNVIWGDARQGVPIADVYYVWTSDRPLLDILAHLKGTVILGHYKTDIKKESQFPIDQKILVPFIEGQEGEYQGEFELWVLNQ